MTADRDERIALRWTWRLHGLPSPLQRAALGLLSLRHPAAAAAARGQIARGERFASILDHSPQSLIASVFEERPGEPDAAAEQRVGRRFGAWRVEALLGMGGMGTVYRAARDDGTYEREVALKCMHGKLVSPGAVQAFRTERNALAKLNHRDIVPILDGGIEDDGTPWFVMPLVEGPPVSQWCDDRALSVRERVRLLAEACDALAHAHGRGVLHQDIKPIALLVGGDGHVKLLDFGLAEIAGADRAARPYAYSPGFAAPELLGGGRPSVAIDVYAMGALAYCLLCAQVPTASSMAYAPLAMVLRNKAEAPSGMALGVSRRACRARACKTADHLHRQLKGDLDAIAMKCVAADPADRYETVAALRDDLVRWMEKRPISLREGAGYRAALFLRRNAVQVSVACVLLATAGLFGTLAFWQRQQAAQELERSTRANQIFSQSLGSAALSHTQDLPLSSTALLDRTETNLRRYSAKDAPDVLARGLSILARSQTDAGNYEKAERLAVESYRAGSDAPLQFAFNQVTLARLHNLRARHGVAAHDAAVGLDKLRFVPSRQGRLAQLQLRMQLAIAKDGLDDGHAAQSILNAAIDEAEKLDTPAGDLVLAQMLILRGSWYRQRLMVDASEQDLMRAVELARGTEPRIVDDARESLIRTVRASRKPEREMRALALAKELLESRTQTLGDRHPQTGVAWGELAFMQMLDRDNAGARASVGQADTILAATLGKRHPAYARVLVTDSHLLMFDGRLQDAVARTKEALDIFERHYGRFHELTLDARFLLANQYWRLAGADGGSMDRALALMQETIALYAQRNGEVPAIHRMAYADMLLLAGRQPEAEREIARAKDDAARQYGPHSEEILSARLGECNIVASGREPDDALWSELTSVIADAARADSLYGRAILFAAQLTKADWLAREGDVAAAREALGEARALAERAGNPAWTRKSELELEKLDRRVAKSGSRQGTL